MKHLLLTLMLLPLVIYGQDYVFNDYKFINTNVEIPKEYSNESEIILESHQKMQFVNTKTGDGIAYNLYHEKILVNSNDAIERNNKVYIPFRTDESLLKNMVRVILKSGKIVLFNDKEMQEEVDQETGTKYKYFAIKGLEKGAIIEKIFVLKENPNYSDNYITVTDNHTILNYSFELIYPNHLVFEFKSYNGLPDAVINKEKYEKNHAAFLSAKNITVLTDQKQYTNTHKFMKRLRFKLKENLANGIKNFFNYEEYTTKIYDFVNKEIDKGSMKELDKFIKINKSKPLLDRVKEIEHEVKKRIIFDKYYPGNENIMATLKAKKGSEGDMLRLMTALLKTHGIKHEIVFTTNRYKKTFDPDFETTGNLTVFLIYFPDLNMYMDPTSIDDRMPLIPYGHGHNTGLFIKEREFGGEKMGVGKLGFIELPETTKDTMYIKVDMSKDAEKPLVTVDLHFNGYAASSLQPIKDFVQPDQYGEILKNIAKNYSIEATEYEEISSKNDGLINLGVKPFILNLKFYSADLVQKVGDTYLVKIGETIGKQIEMYDTLERKLPVEIHYPHYYMRYLELIMPDGYKVTNSKDVDMYYETIMDQKKAALWESKLETKGNKAIITNTEYYAKIDYPLEVYNTYREVVNAAADFNKIVLALKK